ncbi:MAG: hypothetical protein ACLU0O_05415 [Collinsella sp.]
MDPSVYIPAYLERTYLASHPELTDAARELVHNDISANPQKYAQSEHAQALLSYAGVHRHLLDELHRIEDMGSDEEFEQTRNRLFDDMRDELLKIVRIDAHVLDAQLLAIILADTPVDACLGDLMKLEATTADYLQQSVPGFDMEAPHYWANNVLTDGATAADLTVSEPALIGWLPHSRPSRSCAWRALVTVLPPTTPAVFLRRKATHPSRRHRVARPRSPGRPGRLFALAHQLEEQMGADTLENSPGTCSPARSCCSKRTRCARRHARCVSLPTAARAARSSY